MTVLYLIMKNKNFCGHGRNRIIDDTRELAGKQRETVVSLVSDSVARRALKN